MLKQLLSNFIIYFGIIADVHFMFNLLCFYKIAGKRCQSEYDDDCATPQEGSGANNDTSGSGYYTVQDYRDILQYAKDRHIEVIPEIDMPGHSSAAIAVMEERENRIEFMKSHSYTPLPESLLLYDYKLKPKAFSVLKWKRTAMNPCMNSTYRYI